MALNRSRTVYQIDPYVFRFSNCQSITSFRTGSGGILHQVPGAGMRIATYNGCLWKNAIYTTKKMKRSLPLFIVQSAERLRSIPSNGAGEQRSPAFLRAPTSATGRNLRRHGITESVWTTNCAARIHVAAKRLKLPRCRRWSSTRRQR